MKLSGHRAHDPQKQSRCVRHADSGRPGQRPRRSQTYAWVMALETEMGVRLDHAQNSWSAWVQGLSMCHAPRRRADRGSGACTGLTSASMAQEHGCTFILSHPLNDFALGPQGQIQSKAMAKPARPAASDRNAVMSKVDTTPTPDDTSAALARENL